MSCIQSSKISCGNTMESVHVIVTEYMIAHYRCPRCHREVVANDASCPRKGKFGNNTIAQATLLKYEDRLPHRKIQSAMKRTHGLKISPATIFDLTRRAADAIRPDYDAILNRIRGAPILYVDETSIRVQGERHWIWTFSTPSESLFCDSEESRNEGPDRSLDSKIQGYNRVRRLETICQIH